MRPADRDSLAETAAVSVIMPAYNEEGSIEAAVREVQREILDPLGGELLVVEDGSRDRTLEILRQLAADDPRIHVHHKTNEGHGPAILYGLDRARGAWVFLLDSDRQIPLRGFAATWQLAQGGRDGVFGIRSSRDDPRFRLILTRVIRFAIRLLFRCRLQDANIPYKLLRRDRWSEARRFIGDGTLAPSLFLAIVAARRGWDVLHVPVEHRARATGVSIRRWRLMKFCWRAFRQLLAFRRKLA